MQGTNMSQNLDTVLSYWHACGMRSAHTADNTCLPPILLPETD